MLIGLGTGSTGTAELAKRLALPHEKHWLPWDPDHVALARALPEIRAAGGEVGLYFLPYVEAILLAEPDTRFVCMQRDPGRIVRGLVRKVGNPFSELDTARGFQHGFPWYEEGVTADEGAARFYREYYARAYQLQRRFPDRFAIFFTDHLLGATDPSQLDEARFVDLCRSVQTDFEHFSGTARRNCA